MKIRYIPAMAALCALSSTVQADVVLGSYNFNSQQFGNTLVESDGGTYSAANWLNIVNVNPGNPGYLTGANFNTGIANIGLGGTLLYNIGYNTAIVNGPGADLGIVTARYSTDTIRMDVSSNGGTSFLGFQSFAASSGVDSGADCNYFYGGGGPFNCDLFVTEVDLSVFGVAPGGSINMVSISGSPELDLIRVAGFGNPGDTSTVPEPGTLALTALALLGLGAARRRRT